MKKTFDFFSPSIFSGQNTRNAQIRQLEGESFLQAMARHIEQKIRTEFYDKNPFNGGSVLDVGSRDGRFLSIAKNLGAEKAIPIEPDISTLTPEELKLLQENNLFNGTIEDFAARNNTTYEGALILNCSPLANPETMVSSIIKILKKDGVAVFSFAEKEPTFDNFLPVIKKKFSNYSLYGDLSDTTWGPHHIMVIAKKES